MVRRTLVGLFALSTIVSADLYKDINFDKLGVEKAVFVKNFENAVKSVKKKKIKFENLHNIGDAKILYGDILIIDQNVKAPVLISADGRIVTSIGSLFLASKKDGQIVSRAAKSVISYNKNNKNLTKKKSLYELIGKIPSEYIVDIPAKNSTNSVTIIVSDPECPYCRKELSHLKEKMINSNIKMIFVPVHGKSSLQKAQLILDNIDKNSTTTQKIDVLKKYFDKSYKMTSSDSKVSTNKIYSIKKMVMKETGIRGVPFIAQTTKEKLNGKSN